MVGGNLQMPPIKRPSLPSNSDVIKRPSSSGGGIGTRPWMSRGGGGNPGNSHLNPSTKAPPSTSQTQSSSASQQQRPGVEAASSEAESSPAMFLFRGGPHRNPGGGGGGGVGVAGNPGVPASPLRHRGQPGTTSGPATLASGASLGSAGSSGTFSSPESFGASSAAGADEAAAESGGALVRRGGGGAGAFADVEEERGDVVVEGGAKARVGGAGQRFAKRSRSPVPPPPPQRGRWDMEEDDDGSEELVESFSNGSEEDVEEAGPEVGKRPRMAGKSGAEGKGGDQEMARRMQRAPSPMDAGAVQKPGAGRGEEQFMSGDEYFFNEGWDDEEDDPRPGDAKVDGGEGQPSEFRGRADGAGGAEEGSEYRDEAGRHEDAEAMKHDAGAGEVREKVGGGVGPAKLTAATSSRTLGQLWKTNYMMPNSEPQRESMEDLEAKVNDIAAKVVERMKDIVKVYRDYDAFSTSVRNRLARRREALEESSAALEERKRKTRTQFISFFDNTQVA
ncbi:hypothetical protein HDU96_009395 [Phlyctochytrium bullatum]|nr:hypothetical protein HDU96_009395 [Phlyctochytrium bullatum]